MIMKIFIGRRLLKYGAGIQEPYPLIVTNFSSHATFFLRLGVRTYTSFASIYRYAQRRHGSNIA